MTPKALLSLDKTSHAPCFFCQYSYENKICINPQPKNALFPPFYPFITKVSFSPLDLFSNFGCKITEFSPSRNHLNPLSGPKWFRGYGNVKQTWFRQQYLVIALWHCYTLSIPIKLFFSSFRDCLNFVPSTNGN